MSPNINWKRVLVLAMLFWPVAVFFIALFPLRLIFSDGDTLLQFYPYAAHLHRALEARTSPLFSNGILGGFPLGATMTGGFFNPLHLAVFRLFDILDGYHALSLFYWGGGLAAMYVFLRALGLPRYSSAFGSLTYALSQSALGWLPLLPNSQVIFLLPVLCYAVLKIRESIFAWGVVAVALTWGFVGAAPQAIVVAACVGGAFALFLDCRQQESGTRRFKGTIRYILAGSSAMAIASPYLLFAQTYNVLSARPHLTLAEYGNGFVYPSIFLRYIFPSFELPYIVIAGPVSMGLIATFFALLGMRYLWKKEPLVKFFGLLAIICILATLKYSPIALLLHYIPVFKLFRGPLRYTFFTNFGLAVLAAYAFSYFETGALRSIFSRWFAWLWRVWLGVGALAVFATIGAALFHGRLRDMLFSYFDAHLYRNTSGLPLEYYHRVLEARYLEPVLKAFSLLHLPFLLTFGTGIAVLALSRRITRKAAATTLEMAFLVLLPGIELAGGYMMTTPFVSREVLEEPATSKVIRGVESRNEMPSRAFSLWPAAEQYRRIVVPDSRDISGGAAFALGMLAPNTGLFSGVPTIDGYENLMPKNLADILAAAGSERATSEGKLAALSVADSEKIRTFLDRLPLLGRLGVRYIVSATELRHSSLSLIAKEEITAHHIPVYVYEYAGVHGILEFADDVDFGELSEDALESWFLRLSETPHAPVRIGCDNCRVLGFANSDADAMAIEEYRDGYVRLSATTQKGRWLVFRMTRLPGWKASMDGVRVPIYQADGVFQAIYVSAGTHSVSFEFSYHSGLW